MRLCRCCNKVISHCLYSLAGSAAHKMVCTTRRPHWWRHIVLISNSAIDWLIDWLNSCTDARDSHVIICHHCSHHCLLFALTILCTAATTRHVFARRTKQTLFHLLHRTTVVIFDCADNLSDWHELSWYHMWSLLHTLNSFQKHLAGIWQAMQQLYKGDLFGGHQKALMLVPKQDIHVQQAIATWDYLPEPMRRHMSHEWREFASRNDRQLSCGLLQLQQ